MGTEELPADKGVAIVGDERRDIAAGTPVYVPPGVLHGFENPGESVQESQAVVPSAEDVSPRRSEAGWSDSWRGRQDTSLTTHAERARS
jgi:hypothetical protein